MQRDRDVVNAVLNGQRDAYATLVERYEIAVRAVAVRIVKDLHTAEDVAQDSFIKAYENLGRLRSGSAFGPWILQITRRCALDAVHRRETRKTFEEQAQFVAVSRRDGHLEDESRRLLEAVMDLRGHERTVLLLRYLEGHSVRAISTLTGRTVGTITKQLSRAYSRLRKKLKG